MATPQSAGKVLLWPVMIPGKSMSTEESFETAAYPLQKGFVVA
jgi:hypothetical protein